MVEIYSRNPLKIVEGVPVFADIENSRYVENYNKIACDHLASMCAGHGNPFMEEEMWKDIESNTIDLIEKLVPPRSRILDVGVGTGRLLNRFPQLERYGVDVALGYLNRLKETGITAALANLEDLPYKSEMFDAVVCTDVLEHVFELHKAVGELHRVLKPGGILVIRVPYREDLSLYVSEKYPYEFAHVRNFDEYSLQILFCRVFGLSLLAKCMDRAFSPARLKWPFPRGKTTATRPLAAISRAARSLRHLLLKCYHPVEITMAFKK